MIQIAEIAGIFDLLPNAKNILKGKLLGNKVYPFITDEIYCDIDSKKDFQLAEIIVKNFRSYK